VTGATGVGDLPGGALRSLHGAARVRPLRAGDDAAVRALFRDTIALGRPLPFAASGLGAYERLCLDWYLDQGREVAGVLDRGGVVRGYVLVCLDEEAHRRWAVPRAVAWAAGSLLATAGRGPAARFTRLRVRDAVAAWHAAPPSPYPVHAHFNVARGARAGRAGLALAAHVDEVCRDHGVPGWYGEMNAPAGRRATALEHLGGRVVHRQRNATLSWLAGHDIDRLTVTSPLPR